jgi:nucleoside-diphosphate-sugar epimerase
MNNNILITGASGFIGSFLVEEALRKGYDVYAGIRRSSSKQFLQDKKIQFLELDFSSQATLEQQLTAFKQQNGGFDYVIHNAGITQAKRKEEFFTVNRDYTQNLVEALVGSGIELKKFVLISSLAAYGPGNRETFAPIHVAHKKQPVSVYGNSKLSAEEFIRTTNSFPYLIINPTAVYGPRDKDFLEFVKLINKGLEPYIGRNKQMISLIYVKDLARAVIGLLDTPSVNCSYIVSDGIDYNKEILGTTVKSLLNKKTLKIKIPELPIRIVITAIEKVHQLFWNRLPFLNIDKVNEISSPNWLCNSSQLWDDLTSAPNYFLEDGMKETVMWYKENGWL